MNFKKEKGSITVFVLIALLFMSAFLIISYSSNVNKSKTVKEQLEIINSIYKIKIQTTNDIYNKITSAPTIVAFDEIYVRYNSINEYIKASDGQKITEIMIKIDGREFYNEEDMNKYIEENNAYGKKTIEISATNDLRNTTTKTLTVTFKAIEDPVIKTLPSTVITNVTEVSDSYVSYDELGKNEEIYTIVGINTEFTSFSELVKYADDWLKNNNQYEVDVNIKIKATGVNKLISESIQQVKFIRGINVKNETELNTALAMTSPLYIYVTNDIVCSNTISLNGVTHTIDLNNNTISKTVVNESFTFITLGQNTNLTIIDTSVEKQGTILASLEEETKSNGKKRETNITCIKNDGVLTIESGTVSANSVQKMLAEDSNTSVKNSCTAINNTKTVNLNGGTIYSNIVTQACTDILVRTSTANARGVVNSGTVNLNSGAITTTAHAYMVRPNGATVWGKTYAYAYGIENSGTVNGRENITFTTTVRAHQTDTYSSDEDSADVK